MKTRLSILRLLGVALIALPANGALGQPTGSTPGQTFIANPQPAVTNSFSPAPATQAPAPARSQAEWLPRQPGPARPAPYLSPWLSELVKMARAGIGDNVLLWYINSAGAFNLGSDQIIYLRDLGVSGPVIAAMIRHDLDFASGWVPTPSPTAPVPEPAFHFTAPAKEASPGAAATATTPASTAAVQASGDSDSILLEWTHTEPLLLPFESAPVLPDYYSPEAQTAAAARYPVREPYPAAITVPLLFVPMVEQVPNLVVVQMMP
jgi:hypothetical protein